MSRITSHILDTTLGAPAAGVPVVLEHETEKGWKALGKGATNSDGRINALLPDGAVLREGKYRLVFDTAAYFTAQKAQAFYPQIVIVFRVDDGDQHYHIPLLLSRFGYTTYRGS